MSLQPTRRDYTLTWPWIPRLNANNKKTHSYCSVNIFIGIWFLDPYPTHSVNDYREVWWNALFDSLKSSLIFIQSRFCLWFCLYFLRKTNHLVQRSRTWSFLVDFSAIDQLHDRVNVRLSLWFSPVFLIRSWMMIRFLLSWRWWSLNDWCFFIGSFFFFFLLKHFLKNLLQNL